MVYRRRKRQAARLARVQDYFAQKAMETHMGCNPNTDESTTSTPKLTIPSSGNTHSQQGCSMDTPPIIMYHQIPLLSLDWGSTTTTPSQANPPDACSKTGHRVEDHLAISASEAWETFLKSTDMQDQVCVPPESDVSVSMEDKGSEKDLSQESADRKAMETVKSDPIEQSKLLSTGPSRDYQLVKEPRVTTPACSAQGSEPEGAGSELVPPCEGQASHPELTSGSLSRDTTKANPGDETRSAHDTETQNSKAGDAISPEECTGSSDTSKVKENTQRVVKDSLTFTGIMDVPLTNRQAEGAPSERRDINKDASEEQVEIRVFCREIHEEDTESGRKGLVETTTDHSADIQSVSSSASEAFNESELCASNKSSNKDNSELLKNEERRFEANEGLEMKVTTVEAASVGEDEMRSEELIEDSRAVGEDCTDGEEKEFQATKCAPTHLPAYVRGSTDPSRHLLKEASAEKDFELGKTIRHFQEPQRLDGEDELSTPLPSIQLSWVGGNSSRLLRDFCSLGHTAKALVYALLFVIFITVYLYDLPTCMTLYRLDGAVDVD